ncbi:MAG: YggS family pyridoxal phosphate-dependent enzyme, partial [Zavarzinella sp.]|nr:YggS family pyridoxal phosphate-dependent enzyme [Zavarzinella sp.]
TELRTVLADRIAAVRSRIAAACARVGRDPSAVTLVAVTKTVSPRVAGFLSDLGVPDLGESRPQELWHKAAELKDRPIRWHLIGHLQRNKVERTLPLVHLIHSVDSLRLFEAIAIEGQKRGLNPGLLLEINASREEQKHGFSYDEVRAGEWEFENRPGHVCGLMCMAAYSGDPEHARPAFRELRQFRDRLRQDWLIVGPQLEHLSMGMSSDFEVAIEEGATLVRIGTTIFERLEGE